jgi:hypothetical protein
MNAAVQHKGKKKSKSQQAENDFPRGVSTLTPSYVQSLVHGLSYTLMRAKKGAQVGLVLVLLCPCMCFSGAGRA